MSQSMLELVLQWSDAYAKNDFDAALQLVADDAEWCVWGSDCLPWQERSNGHAEILKTWQQQEASFTRQEMTIETMVPAENELIAFGEITDISCARQEVANFKFCARFEVQDQKITRYQMYSNPKEFFDAL